MQRTDEIIFHQGYDNARCLSLTKRDCSTGAYNPIDLAPITEFRLIFQEILYSSSDNPGVFDATVDPNNGRLDIKLGLLTNPQIIPLGKDKKSELILIDTSNPNGLVMDYYLNINILAAE